MSRAPTVYSMLSPGTHLAQYAFAVMHSQLGDNEEAFAALNAALDERGGMDVFAGVDPAKKSETVHGIYPPLIASRPEAIRVFHTPAEYFDIGSPRDYLDTAITIAAREGKPLDRGVGCEVAPGAHYSHSALVMGQNGLSAHRWNPA